MVESLLGKSRVRALDHPTLRFLSIKFSRSVSRSSSESNSVNPKRLTNQPLFDFFLPPVPQSGSSKIVFATNRDGTMQIYSMNADGSNLIRLTDSGANDDFPRWSPNGTKILFQSDRDHPDTGHMDIYAMNSDGAGVTRLATDANDDSMANWSPDGSRVVFQTMRNGVKYQVYAMNADGASQINLTNTSANDGEPSWSPDGSKIAFQSDRDHAGFSCIYVMNSNGSGQQRLTFTSGEAADTQPSWSRDGNKIAFVSTRDSVLEQWQETDDFEIPEDDRQVITKSKLHLNKEVYVMNANGSGQTRLTNELANDDSPSWSPDGSKIVFRSDRERDCCDPTAQVWMMNADGTNQTNLSNSGNGDYSASWTSGSSNQSPIANAGGVYSGILAQNVPFNSNGSFDPDGSIVSYVWNFGDGGTATGVGPTHAYIATGTYTVTLTVTDNLGAQGSVSTTVTISSSSGDQYAVNFLQYGLGTSPNGEQSGYWTDIMRAAYAQGQPSMLMAMTEFGMTVFESADYADRGRNDHDYVYDLYKTYLMREPDQEGWDFWTYQASPQHMGRSQVRNAFEVSSEFHNIVATLVASGNPSAAVSSLATAQVDLFNQSGNHVQARDCEFSVPLLSLPGRAGLDLGLSLSYSSLVWTRSGPYVYFDSDQESLSPGFTIGFPTVQWRKFDAQTRRNVYVFTAGGRHVELRQVGTSNLYEAADSSYLQLTDHTSSLIIQSTDGTQIEYENKANGWVAKQIEDRNGNLITINNDWRGDIQNIIDTLGRVIRFNYDGNANLISITQDGWSQPWATFGWGVTPQMQMPAGAQAVGTFSGEIIPVLSQVGLPDGSRYNFEYNSAAQANVVRRTTSDNVHRSQTVYNYGAADDSTRLTSVRVSADNWTNTETLPASYVETQYNVEGSAHTVTVAGDPNATTYKEFYGTGWQKGLITGTEIWGKKDEEHPVQRQKWTTTSWVQDDPEPNALYRSNPRVIATDVFDNINHSHTVIGYQTFALPFSNANCSLPNDVYEYAADQTTVLRRMHTDYNLDSVYLNRRIVGLPQAKLLYEGTSTLMSKTTYVYDWGGEFLQGLPAAPTQHDGSFSTDIVGGRANLVAVQHWDVNYPTDGNKVTENKIGYDITGNVIFTRDALNHQTSISYADAFSIDGANLDAPRGFVTYAYPTTVTDPGGISSTLWYRYEFGAKARAQGPPPQNQSNGVIQTFSYDNAARLQRATTANTGAYVHYVYWPNYTQTYSSVNNVAQNYWESDAYAIQVFDGTGRLIYGGGNNPGSIGGYRTVSSIYDRMGRLAAQSNPTEITGAGVPAGDDDPNNPNGLGHGFVYTQYTYDWKGRPLLTINPSTTSNPNEVTYKEASYDGCGCAGGEAVTLTDEVERQQKVYSDVLGRQWKTEVMTWPDADNNRSVYSSSTSVYDARDQVTQVKAYAGVAPLDASSTNPNASCPMGNCQEALMTFDGYGRLKTKHVPEQNAGAATVYEYNTDDTIQKVTDARGAFATYQYNNNRHLVTGISYQSGGGEPDTPDVSFGYDAAGNRTSMTDGLGNVTYNYDSLSRMSSETRTFDGVGSFTLGYDYNFAGELTRITDPANASIYYSHDAIGRITGVTGSPYGTGNVNGTPYIEISQYASSLQYRASGQLKSMSYGNGLTLAAGFDSRLRVAQFEVAGAPAPFGPTVMKTQYQYHDDSNPKYAHDVLDGRFDRAFVYDHTAMLKEAYSGSESRDFLNNTNSGTPTGPYRQSYGHDTFGNLTNRTNRFWSQSDTLTTSYLNNRRQDPAFHYDVAGNLTQDADLQYTYDAAGLSTSTFSAAANKTVSPLHDGDGDVIGQSETESGTTTVTRHVRSSVLGRVITELNAQGAKLKTYVYLGAQVIARQEPNWVVWQHEDPLTGSRGISNRDGGFALDRNPDPMGVDLGSFDPYIQPELWEPPSDGMVGLLAGSGIPSGRCMLDGMAIMCEQAAQMLHRGNVEFEQPTTVWANSQWNFVRFNPASGNHEAQVYSSNPELREIERRSGRDPATVTVGNNLGGLFGLLPFAVHDVWLQTPEQMRRRKMTPEEVMNLRDQLQSVLKGKCKELMDGIMNYIPGARNLMDVFNYMADNGGLHRQDYLRSEKGYQIGGFGGGNVVDGTADVTISYTFGNVLFTLMHEVTHGSGGAGSKYVSHYTMARAAISAAADAKINLWKYQQGPPSDLKFELWDESVPNAENHNSSVFQSIMQIVCLPYAKK